MLEIIFLLGICLFGVIVFVATSYINQGDRSSSTQTIDPIPQTTAQYLIQILGFQEAKNKRFSFSRYTGEYQERNAEIYIDSDDFFTAQMSFSNSKNHIFQVQGKYDTSPIDKLVLAAYNGKVFLDQQSGRKFAIYTKPENLRAKIFFTNSPIWENLRKLPSFDCSLEVGFSVKSSNSLIYQHSYVHQVKPEMMVNLLKVMDECCKVLEQI